MLQPARKQNDRLADFVEMRWTMQGEEREHWETLLRAFKARWKHLEWLSVIEGIRRCAYTPIAFADLPSVSQSMLELGLAVMPVFEAARSDSQYSTAVIQPVNTGYSDLMCVIAPPRQASAFMEAARVNDHEYMGLQLGYPGCCREFFRSLWPLGYIDTTWQMGCNTAEAKIVENRCEVAAAWQTNVLHRWIGVRAVPHLPCSFQCKGTISFANELNQLAEDHGYSELNQSLLDIVRSPVIWCAMQGIARVKCVFGEITTNTDFSSEEYEVEVSLA